MVLRIRKKCINTETKSEWVTDNFFDNFDHANIEEVNIKEEKFASGCSVSCFTTDETKFCKRISLARGDNSLARMIYVDVSYDIYLMSNEGKTIERL